jgi:hypothetical protein
MGIVVEEEVGKARFRIQNTEFRIQNTEYRIQNAEDRIQEPEDRSKSKRAYLIETFDNR